MRVLHCIPTLLGGGAERQLAYLAEGLRDLGIEVHVAYAVDGPNSPRLRAAATSHLLAEHPLRLAMQLGEVVSTVRPDVIHTWFRKMDVLGGSLALVRRIPWVASERSVWVPTGTLAERAHLALMRRASHIIANSEVGAGFWRTSMPDAARVEVIHNALPIDEIDRADACRVPAVNGSPRVLFVGRFDPLKNIPCLAESMASLLRARPHVHLLVCGLGPLEHVLREAVERAQVGARVHFLGYRADVWSVMKAATVMISPSHHEGCPNAVLEAMACGLPLCLSDIAEHRECVPVGAAHFFPKDSPAAAQAAVLRVLDGDGPSVALARAAVEGRSIEQLARRHADAYRRLIR